MKTQSRRLKSASSPAIEDLRITLGGKTHRLRYGLRALHYLEKQFGAIRVFDERLRQTEWGEDRIRAVVAALTAGLLHEKPAEMTLDDFEELVVDELDAAGGLAGWAQTLMRAAITARVKE